MDLGGASTQISVAYMDGAAPSMADDEDDVAAAGIEWRDRQDGASWLQVYGRNYSVYSQSNLSEQLATGSCRSCAGTTPSSYR